MTLIRKRALTGLLAIALVAGIACILFGNWKRDVSHLDNDGSDKSSAVERAAETQSDSKPSRHRNGRELSGNPDRLITESAHMPLPARRESHHF